MTLTQAIHDGYATAVYVNYGTYVHVVKPCAIDIALNESISKTSKLRYNCVMKMSRNDEQCEWQMLNDPYGKASVKLSNNVKTLKNFSFFLHQFPDLQNLLGNSKVERIGMFAFALNYALGKSDNLQQDSICFPATLNSLDIGAFDGCPYLKIARIPKTLETMKPMCFHNNKSMKFMVFLGRTKTEIEAMPYYGQWTNSTAVQYVPGIVDGKENPNIYTLNELDPNNFKPTHRHVDTARYKILMRSWFDYVVDGISDAIEAGASTIDAIEAGASTIEDIADSVSDIVEDSFDSSKDGFFVRGDSGPYDPDSGKGGFVVGYRWTF